MGNIWNLKRQTTERSCRRHHVERDSHFARFVEGLDLLDDRLHVADLHAEAVGRRAVAVPGLARLLGAEGFELGHHFFARHQNFSGSRRAAGLERCLSTALPRDRLKKQDF